MRTTLLAIAVAAAVVPIAGCGEDEPAPAATAPVVETTPHARPIAAGYCLQGAGVQKVAAVADLSFVADRALNKDVATQTGVGKKTASFTTGRDHIYVVGRPGQQISPTTVLTSPMTYEFVGFMRAPARAAAAKANDCLDGLVGDDR
jgi:hypothetical protein